ncbi:uncharacterized protein C1orf94 isoform X2 [Xenopus laevis]|uniref:Uncharacterized protein C1orf94 isoform X2 n=1 Tax=Xenopus laevis TaxID=8355 RepID=A0A8J0UHU8_XENLA|nr:uncharacterized protein C1orf94 isoform X2 [Xenopus laevis]
MLSPVTASQWCSATPSQAPPIGPFPRYIWVHQHTPQDSLDKACYEIWKRVQSSLEDINSGKLSKPLASEKIKKREAAGTKKRDIASMKMKRSVERTTDKYDIFCLVAQEYCCLLMESTEGKECQKKDFLVEDAQKEQVKEKLCAKKCDQKDTHPSAGKISTSMALLNHMEVCRVDKTSRLSVSSSKKDRQLEKKKDEPENKPKLIDHKEKVDSKINARFAIKATTPTPRQNKQPYTGHTYPSQISYFSSIIRNNMLLNTFPRGQSFVQYQSSFHNQQRFWMPPFSPVLQAHVGGYIGMFNPHQVAQTLFYSSYPSLFSFNPYFQPDYIHQQRNFPKGNTNMKFPPLLAGDGLPYQFPHPHRFNPPFPGAGMSNAYFTYSRK